MEGHFATQDNTHDDTRIGQVVVICGIVIAQFDTQIKLWQRDVLVDIVAILPLELHLFGSVAKAF